MIKAEKAIFKQINETFLIEIFTILNLRMTINYQLKDFNLKDLTKVEALSFRLCYIYCSKVFG